MAIILDRFREGRLSEANRPAHLESMCLAEGRRPGGDLSVSHTHEDASGDILERQ